MNKKVIVMLDGGHLRVLTRKAHKPYDPTYIEKIAHASCAPDNENLFRVLYYDCAPYQGTLTLPVSGTKKEYTASDKWLNDLAYKELFAVRRGELKFRGFALRNIPFQPSGPLTDNDFQPQFEQKGVDMRIGLDMATIAAVRSVELIAIATNDTDCIPAMRHVRRSGLQVALIVVPGYRPAPELLAHSDFHRVVSWPAV